MIPHSEFVPPMRHGVSASQIFLPVLDPVPTTLYAYFCQQFAHISAIEWQQRFTDGLILNAQGQALTADAPYLAQQHIYYYRFLPREIEVPFAHHILFENEHLLVVDKPHFLTISPTGKYVQQTLLVRLKQQTGNPHLTPIHRLDRETAGIVLFSKRIESRGLYQQLFAQRQVTKIYHAIAPYCADLICPHIVQLNMQKGQPFYTMQVVEGKPNSETRIEILQHHQQWAKYELHPLTGKQHQLRVHLSHLGLAIKNDPLYPTVKRKAEDDFSAPLQLLAKHLGFIDPITQEKLNFTSTFELELPNVQEEI